MTRAPRLLDVKSLWVMVLLAVFVALSCAVAADTPVMIDESEIVPVHVLEKCCPFATKYVVGEYDSQEASGWRLALSFQAFRYSNTTNDSTADRKCYTIANISTSRFVSQGFRPMNVNSSSAVTAPAAFCVYRKSLQSKSQEEFKKFLYYGENEFKNVSIIEANVSIDVMEDRGWLHETALYRHFRPIAYHVWDAAKPAPMNLITKVSVMESRLGFPDTCKGGKIEGGDYNQDFHNDSFVSLCVEYSEPVVYSSRAVVADDNPSKTYVSGLLSQAYNNSVEDGECPEDMEPVMSRTSSARSKPFKFTANATAYVVLCLTKSHAVVDTGNGTRIADSKFLSRISVDTKRDRPLRVIFEEHDPIDWSTPNDAKDERWVNMVFDA